MKLKYLTDKQLLLDTKNLAAEERRITAKLLQHIQEIEVRRLYSDLGYSSVFKYLVARHGEELILQD